MEVLKEAKREAKQRNLQIRKGTLISSSIPTQISPQKTTPPKNAARTSTCLMDENKHVKYKITSADLTHCSLAHGTRRHTVPQAPMQPSPNAPSFPPDATRSVVPPSHGAKGIFPQPQKAAGVRGSSEQERARCCATTSDIDIDLSTEGHCPCIIRFDAACGLNRTVFYLVLVLS